jgi:predicted Zn-dependent peptidase
MAPAIPSQGVDRSIESALPIAAIFRYAFLPMAAEPVTRDFPNGLRACVEHHPGAAAFSMSMLFAGGAADDPADRLGLANIMETALMKGTARRDARGVFDGFDSLGVARGGGAGVETVSFDAGLLPRHAAAALKLYREVFEEAAFPDDEIDLARRLAAQELEGLDDKPQQKAGIIARRGALGDPLGRSALGTREGVAAVTTGEVRAQRARLLAPGRMIISGAGGLAPEDFFRAVEAAFGDWRAPGKFPPARPVSVQAGTLHERKESEQAHVVIIYPGTQRGAKDYYAAELAMTVLSGSGSSRLFVEVREKRGLCYSVGASNNAIRGGAYTLLYAGTTAARAQETLDVCLAEVARFGEDLTAEELERAKNIRLGRLRTVGELSGARASAMAGDLYIEGRPRPLAEIAGKLESVTLDQALAAARRCRPEPMFVAVLGPEGLKR